MKPNLTIHQHIDHYRREWPNGLAEVLHRIAGNQGMADKAAELLPDVRSFSVVSAEVDAPEKPEFEPHFLPPAVPLTLDAKPKKGKS